MDYGSLREPYPATISMNQLYHICHSSKRKARWLLEQGIIPCVDSEKKTRRFSIQLEDVITFLERRDTGLLEEAIPRGAFSGGSRPVCPARRALDEARLCAYLLERWQGCPDMLTVHQASELCGYSRSALHHWLDAGKIKGLNYRGATLLSKESLARWLTSPGGQNIAALSEQHLTWMKDFQAVKSKPPAKPEA